MPNVNVHWGPPDGDWGMMPHMWNTTGPGMLLMGVSWLLILVLMVLAAVWLFRNLSPGQSAPSEDALELLKRRYARGDIDKDEYERIRRDIT